MLVLDDVGMMYSLIMMLEWFWRLVIWGTTSPDNVLIYYDKEGRHEPDILALYKVIVF